jgi:hypothetical protein
MDLIIKSFLVAIIWGLFPFAVRYMSKTLPLSVIPLLLSFVWFVSSFVQNIYKYKSSLFKTYLSKLGVIDMMILVLSGFVFMFLKNVLYVDVVSNSTPATVNIYISIMSLSSLVSLLYVLYVEGVRLSKMVILGICFVSVGIFMLYNGLRG